MRTKIFYLYDTDTKANIAKFDILSDLHAEKRKLNEKEGRQRYVLNSSWSINKIQ